MSIIKTTLEDHIAIVTINRPEAYNAMNPDVIERLENQINELYEVTRPKLEDIVDSKVDEFIGSKQKGRFKIERLKQKKLDRNVILDTSSGSIYAIGKENEPCQKIHWIN